MRILERAGSDTQKRNNESVKLTAKLFGTND